jgi:hypothetical protein
VKGHFLFFWSCGPTRTRASSFTRFLYHTQRRTTVGRTPLNEWSVRRRDHLTTYNTHNRQTSMSPAGFKPTISAGERPQTNPLDRAASGTGNRTKKSQSRFTGLFNTSTAWVYCILTPKSSHIHLQRRHASYRSARPLSAKAGTIRPNFASRSVIYKNKLASFTCRKAGTWDILFYFLSEGRHTEDFPDARKIQRLRELGFQWPVC